MQRMLAVVTGLMVAGCSGDQRPPVGSTGATALATAVSPQTSTAEAIEAATEARLAAQRSMASKVLAGVAIERVTGKKPYPPPLAVR